MSLMARSFLGVAIAVFAYVPAASAQSSGTGCALGRVAGTLMQILRCQDGLTITPEAGAQFALEDRDRDGNADSVTLRLKALLIDGPAGKGKAGFQVITPQAIAAVRGTKWAVDVQSGRASVFVVSGRVAVRRPAAKTGVILGPGEGVDVEDGAAPLTVRRWPAERVAKLMARFGQ
jgi:ferric-dicitrate binding protein FerR (iron transport regulator)